MNVPITSDLAGYAAFWSRVVACIVVSLGVLLAPVYVLLFLIWRKP